MSNVHPIQTNFTAGEVSQRLDGRVDLSKYANGVTRLENFTLMPHGGATRRWGTRFVREVKTSSKRTYLIPFQFSTTQAYVIEFGDQYMRFYKDGGVILDGASPYEIATPYLEADLADVQYAQSADTMYLVHPSYAPRKLTRTGHTAWTLTQVTFLPPPSQEDDITYAADLTLSAVSGTGITVTASAAIFLAADVDRHIKSGAGRLIITGFTDTTHVTADVIDTFAGTSIASGAWTISGTPYGATCTPSKRRVKQLGTLTLDIAGWRSSDVGKYVHLHGGVVKITAFTSTTVVKMEVFSELSTRDPAEAGAWTLERESWSSANGYPTTVSFFEDRLLFAATTSRPQTWWASQSGDYENFAVGSEAEHALEFTISANEVNAIRWVAPARKLLLGTTGAEFLATGGNDNAPITPDNIRVSSDTTHGSYKARTLRVGGAALFIQVAQRKIRELTYSYEVDSYVAPDLTLLSEHITDPGVTKLVYQQEPDSIVWAMRTDGVLLGMTYMRAEDIVGWHRHITGAAGDASDGKFEDFAVIAATGHDQPWFVVNRTIGGATKRYIEYLDPDLNTDSTLTRTPTGTPVTSVTGLGHLEGQTVAIVGDGAVYPSKVVASGAVSLSPAADDIRVGLLYTSTLTTLRPEVQVQGTIQGRKKRWSEVIVRLYNTLGVKINGEQLPFRSSSDAMDGPPAQLSDDRRVSNLGYDRAGQITVQQAQPLPCTIICITGTLDVPPA